MRGASMGPEALRVAGIGPVAASRSASTSSIAATSRARSIPWQPPRGRLPASRRGRGLEPHRSRRGPCRARRRAHADPARRRSQPRDRLDHRRRAALPRSTARSCASSGSTRTPTSTSTSLDAVRQHPRHAGRGACAARPAELTEIGGRVPAIGAEVDRARSASAPSTRAKSGSSHDSRPRHLRHALHRRGGHADRHGAGARRRSTPTPTCTSASTSTSSTRHRARRRHDGAGRAELSRGAALHGDDRRHRRARARSTSWSSIRRSTSGNRTAELAVELVESLFGEEILARSAVPGRYSL